MGIRSKPGENVRQALTPKGEAIVDPDLETRRLLMDIRRELRKLNMGIAQALLNGTPIRDSDVEE